MFFSTPTDRASKVGEGQFRCNDGCPADAKQSVRVCLSIDDETMCLKVFDHGQGFDLQAMPTPDFVDLDERGRGIFLIRSLMDLVEYRKTDNGNVLEMRKKFA